MLFFWQTVWVLNSSLTVSQLSRVYNSCAFIRFSQKCPRQSNLKTRAVSLRIKYFPGWVSATFWLCNLSYIRLFDILGFLHLSYNLVPCGWCQTLWVPTYFKTICSLRKRGEAMHRQSVQPVQILSPLPDYVTDSSKTRDLYFCSRFCPFTCRWN